MRAVLGFAGKLSLGLMIAVVLGLMVMAMGGAQGQAGAHAGGLDYYSLTVGLVVGITLGALGRIQWALLPRQIANWLFANERYFYLYAMAAAFIAVLLYW